MNRHNEHQRPRAAYHATIPYGNRNRSRRSVAPALPNFMAITDHEYLLGIFREMKSRAGKAPGPDRLRYTDFSVAEIADVLRLFRVELRANRYVPSRHRAVNIPKGEGRFRQLHLRNILDRVVSAAVTKTLTPVLEPMFLSCSFAYRPRKSHYDLLARLLTDMVRQDRWVVAQEDIRGAFDAVRIGDAVCDFRQVTNDGNLLRLIETVLRGYRRQAQVVGIDQGDPLSPSTLNFRLHCAIDRTLLAGDHGPPGYRYSDNLVWLCQEIREGDRIRRDAGEILALHGFALKSGGETINLQRQGQAMELLGFRITLRDAAPRLFLGSNARRKLADSLKRAHGTEEPEENARSVAVGWVLAYGPAFSSEGGEQELITEVQRTAQAVGFQGIIRPDALNSALRKARHAWSESLRKAEHDSEAATGSGPPDVGGGTDVRTAASLETTEVIATSPIVAEFIGTSPR